MVQGWLQPTMTLRIRWGYTKGPPGIRLAETHAPHAGVNDVREPLVRGWK